MLTAQQRNSRQKKNKFHQINMNKVKTRTVP
uniref:Uncharacterized protein n=1 Tax=Anguilla anguilla TaxID=7936 RepID=A0A0E9XEI6_ANGAN